MPHGLRRYQQGGYLHFITFSCHGRKPYLTRHYLLFEQSLEQTRKCYNLEVHGYVLMPEHVHLLFGEPAQEPLGKALQSLKLSVSKAGRRKALLAHPLLRLQRPHWQQADRETSIHAPQPGSPRPGGEPGGLASIQLPPLPHRQTTPAHPPDLPHTLTSPPTQSEA